MLRLIKNETGKIFAKKSSWIYMLILFAVVLTVAIIQQSFFEKPDENWRAELEHEIATLEKQLETASPEDQEWILYQIERNKGYLEENVNPNARSNWHFINNTVYVIMGTMVTLFAAIVAGASVSSEYDAGTIKQLLIRPHYRWQVLLSKYISVLIYSIGLLAVLLVIGFIIGTVFFGTGDFNEKFFEESLEGRKLVSAGEQMLWKVLYYLPGLVIIVTIAFMLSTLFKSQSLAVGVSIFVLFISSTIGGALIMLAEKFEWVKFLIFPHLDLTVYVFQDKILQDVTLPMSLMILAVYYVIFMAVTFTVFQKRDVAG